MFIKKIGNNLAINLMTQLNMQQTIDKRSSTFPTHGRRTHRRLEQAIYGNQVYQFIQSIEP